MPEKEIRTKRSLMESPEFMAIPGEYVLPVLAFVIISATVGVFAGSLNQKNQVKWLLGSIGVGGAGLASWILVMGKKPHKFLGTLNQPTQYVKTFVPAPENPVEAKPAPAVVKVPGEGEKRGIESECPLICMVNYKLKGQEVGAYLLKYEGEYQIVFGFDVIPISTSLPVARYSKLSNRIGGGIDALPLGEKATFVAANFADCSSRIAELKRLQQQAPTPELKYLMSWDISRLEGLTLTSRHNPKTLKFYGSHSLGSSAYKPADWLEQQIYNLIKLFQLSKIFTRSETSVSQAELLEMLLSAYERGFFGWLLNLQRRMGMKVRPFSAHQLWEIDWPKTNRGKAPIIPQVLEVTERGLKWIVNSQKDIKTWLFWQGGPKTDYQWLWFPGKQEYVTAMVMDEIPDKSWKGERAEYDQLQDAVHALNVTPNSEIVCQLRDVSQRAAQEKQAQLAQQAFSSIQEQEKKGRQSLSGNFRLTEYEETYNDLKAGQEVVSFGWVSLLYRKSQPALSLAAHQYSYLFEENTVSRDRGYALQLWKECQPWAWNPLLLNPSNRRLHSTTDAVRGFLPLMLPHSVDRQGIEFIEPESKTPLYVDLFRRPLHFIVTGGTGSGKSVLTWSAIIFPALARGFQVSIVDNTRADGSGTFSAPAKFVGGVYYDVLKESHNLYETPDWRRLDKAEEKRKLFEDNLLDLVLGLSIAADADTQRRSKCKKVHQICFAKFWKSEQIQQRYEFAHDGGFGSTAWLEMPTLVDYLNSFLTVESLPDTTAEYEEIVTEMRLNLTALVSDPKKFNALCRPSTFRSNNPLIVYALSNLKDDEEASPFAASAHSSAIARALQYPKNLFFADEGSTIIKKPSFGGAMGALYSQGRKSDIWVGLAGQTLKTINESPAARDILDNVGVHFVGNINDGAIPILQAEGIPLHLLEKAATEFEIDPSEFCSRWIVRHKKQAWIGDYYPSFANLALSMNFADEEQLKEEFGQRYPNKYESLSKLSAYLKSKSLEAEF